MLDGSCHSDLVETCAGCGAQLVAWSLAMLSQCTLLVLHGMMSIVVAEFPVYQQCVCPHDLTVARSTGHRFFQKPTHMLHQALLQDPACAFQLSDPILRSLCTKVGAVLGGHSC